jgi:hypothetical protein
MGLILALPERPTLREIVSDFRCPLYRLFLDDCIVGDDFRL